MKKYLQSIIWICLILLLPVKVKCAAYTSATSGVWSSTTTWGVSSYPGQLCSTDTVTIAAAHTVTWDIAGTLGLGTGVAGSTALTITGTLDMPYTCATSTMAMKGRITISATTGNWKIGTASTPLLSTNTISILFDGTADNFYITPSRGSGLALGSNMAWYGNYYMNQYSTNPYVTTTINDVTSSSNSVRLATDIQAKAGQIWAFSSTEGQQQVEGMTVSAYDASVPSVTFTSNFAFSHSSGALIALLSHNIICGSTTTARNGGINTGTLGSSVNSSKKYLSHVTFLNSTGIISYSWYNFYDHIALYKGVAAMYFNQIGSSTVSDVVISSRSDSTSSYALYVDICNEPLTFTRVYALMNNSGTGTAPGIFTDQSQATTYNYCYANGGGYAFAPYLTATFTNCSASMIHGFEFSSVNSGLDLLYPNATITNYEYKHLEKTTTRGTNAPTCTFGSYQNAAWRATFLNSKPRNTLFTSGTTPTAGTFLQDLNWASIMRVDCQNFNQEIGSNRTYLQGHSMVQLESTTVRTAGVNGLKFDTGICTAVSGTSYAGVHATPITFPIPCNANETIWVRGYIQKNTSYGSLTLPYIKIENDTGVLSSTSTMSDVNSSWEYVSVTGVVTTSGTLTVYMVAQSTITGSAAYFSDFRAYIGNNAYALGSQFINGYPIASPVSMTIDASNLWNASTSGYSSGTMGYNVGSLLDTQISTGIASINSGVSAIQSTQTIIISNINTSSNTIISAINTSSNTLYASNLTLGTQISTSTANILTNINTSSNTIVGALNTSSNTLAGLIGAISLDTTPIINAIASSSNTLSVQISTSTTQILTNIDTSSNTLSGQIGAIVVDLTPVLTAINTSSNTLSVQISTSTASIEYEIHKSSSEVWNKNIYSTKTASDTLREIRKREP